MVKAASEAITAESTRLGWGEASAPQYWIKQVTLVVGATLLVALCSRVTIPLPFTPVPLTLQNFAVLLVGMLLGPRRAFAALSLYLMEGLSGLPVFNPLGPGGLAQLFGPTGGFLLAYPLVAAIAGWLAERGTRSFVRLLLSGLVAEIFLFACGVSWLFVLIHSLTQAFRFGAYWFVFAEVIKIMMAASVASRWQSAGPPKA